MATGSGASLSGAAPRGRGAGKARAYLELLRPANVATALADVLAGYAIAGRPAGHGLPWLLASTACLYAGGVVLNDFFDRALDAVERPERPIPSGRVSPLAAVWLGGGLLLAGVAAATPVSPAASVIAAAVAALVLLYDAWGKHQTWLGPFNMGACRAGNLLLGVAAAPAALVTAWPLGGLPLVYIGGVTVLSRGEVRGGSRAVAAFSLGCVLVVLAALTAIAWSRPVAIASLALAAAFGWRVLPPFWRAYRSPEPTAIRRAIRAGVLSLVLLDAVLATSYAGVFYGVSVLAVAILAAGLARVFAVT